MARLADGGQDELNGANVYTALLESEEAKFARRGRARPVLVATPGGGRSIKASPTTPPLLAALLAGRPVDISDWQLATWARDAVEEARVRVHPDGRIEELSRPAIGPRTTAH